MKIFVKISKAAIYHYGTVRYFIIKLWNGGNRWFWLNFLLIIWEFAGFVAVFKVLPVHLSRWNPLFSVHLNQAWTFLVLSVYFHLGKQQRQSPNIKCFVLFLMWGRRNYFTLHDCMSCFLETPCCVPVRKHDPSQSVLTGSGSLMLMLDLGVRWWSSWWRSSRP